MKIAQIPGDQIPFSPQLPFSPNSIPAISYLITEELVKRGHQVTVFAPSDSKTSAKIAPGWLSSKDPRFKKYLPLSKKRNQLFRKYCLNVVKQAEQFDIIHSHCHGFFPFIKKIKKPVITTLHNPYFTAQEKRYFSNVMLVGISQKQIKNNRGLNFIGRVYHGLDLKNFPFNPKPKNYLFWISRLSPFKGPLEAIEIAKITGKKLVMAGTYDFKDDFVGEVLRRTNENKNIKFIGKRLTHQKKVYYFKNALAFIFPLQWEEPFGLVMIEAMATGTPVIAFSRGAVPEIVKNGITGFVCKPNDLQSMLKAVKIIENMPGKEYKKMRRHCRKYIEDNFTVEKMVQGYEKIYSKILAEL